MERKHFEKLTGRLADASAERLTFETVDTDANILKAKISHDGKTNSLYVLAIPEDSIEDFNEEEFANEQFAEPEMA